MERAITFLFLKLSNHIVKTSFSKFQYKNTYRLIFFILGSLYFSAHQKMKIQYALIHFLFSHPSNSSVSFSFLSFLFSSVFTFSHSICINFSIIERHVLPSSWYSVFFSRFWYVLSVCLSFIYFFQNKTLLCQTAW